MPQEPSYCHAESSRLHAMRPSGIAMHERSQPPRQRGFKLLRARERASPTCSLIGFLIGLKRFPGERIYVSSSTGRGTFGAAHAFPIRERCLLGSSTRQKVAPSDPDSRERRLLRIGDASPGLAPLRCSTSTNAASASRSLRPLGTGAKSSHAPSTCQRDESNWAARRPG